MNIPMLKCQTRLMGVWMAGCVILLLVAWLQILFGHYGENGKDVIEWLLPAITPTLSLVTGVWAKNALKKSKGAERVGRGIYRAVLAVSIFYLVFLGLIFAIQPLVPLPPVEVIKNSSLIMAPLQGVVCVFIGIFFTQEAKGG